MQTTFLCGAACHNRLSHSVDCHKPLSQTACVVVTIHFSETDEAMRALFFLVLSLCMSCAEAGRAEILAVCGGSSGTGNTSVLRATLKAESIQTPRLALWRDAKGFDLLLNWGTRDQESLRD